MKKLFTAVEDCGGLVIVQEGVDPSTLVSWNAPVSEWPTVIILTREKRSFTREYSKFTTPFAIACVSEGSESFFLDDRPPLLVDEQYYLVINDGQKVCRTVQGDPELAGIIVFFSLRFARSKLAELLLPGDSIHAGLDAQELPVRFAERLYRHDNIVTPRLKRLRETASAKEFDRAAVFFELSALLERLMHVHRSNMYEADSLPFRRHSTRMSMFTCLNRARDYISSSYTEDLTLEAIAEVAGLSPFHFQRCFSDAFGESPHRYLTRCRLNKAKILLQKSGKSVTDICGEVGFESLGSFSTLFTEHYGLSPIRFRQAGSSMFDSH